MKKFIIFFLMVFLCIGNYQARSETKIATDIGKARLGWESLGLCESALLPPYVLDVNREEKITANYITLERNCATGEVTLIADRSYFTTAPDWTGPNAFTSLGQWEIVVNESGLYEATDGANQDEINAEVYAAHDVIIQATTNGATNPFNLGIQGSTTISFAAVIPGNPAPAPGDYNYQWFINGNAVATVDTITGNGINFTFPRNMAAGTYMVTVSATQNASGCVASSSTFQINVGASIAVNIFGPQTACNGEIVTYTAQVDGDEIGHSYQWIRDGQYLPGETGQTYSFNTDSLDENYYSYAVVVTRDGCETTYSPEIPFHIYNLGVELTAEPASICFGNSTMLTANLIDNNGDNIIYRWYEGSIDPANIIRGRTGSQAMVTPGVYGDTQYFVEVSKADASCISIDSITVSATNSLPAVTILMSSDTICEGQAVTLVANAGENAIYTWYRNGYTLPTTNGRVLHDTPSANGTGASVIYTVDIMDPSMGCSYETSASTPVWVNPSISVSITGTPIVCATDSTVITLTATLTGDAGATPVYNWTVNGIAQASTSDVLTFDAAPATEPYEVTVNLNSASGCNVTSEPYYIYVGDAPVVQVSVSHTDVCLGGDVMVEALVGNGDVDGLTYTWTENGTDAPYRGLSFTSTINVNTTFGITIDAGNGCVATGTSPEISVVTLDGLALNVEADIESGCDGAQVIVSATVLDDNGNNVTSGYTYTWFRNGILMEGVTGSSVMESLMSVDGDTTRFIYTASIAVPGCDGNNFSASDTVMIRRNPMVVIDGFHDVCGDATSPNIRLYAWVDGRNNYGASFRWYESGQLKGTFTGNNYYSEDLSPRTDPYVYTVEVINTNGCSNFSDPFEVYIHFPIDAHVTVSEDTVCADAKVLLTANLRNNNAENITYQWYKGAYNNSNIIYGATNKTYLANINESARYYVEVIQLNSSCMDTASYYIHMNDVPQLTDITITSSNVICSGGQITLQANMAGTATGNEVFTWYKNGILMEGATGSTIMDSPIAIDDDETIYYYSAAVAQSASACISARVTSPMVTVFGNPRVMISGDQYVCETQSVFLIANVDTSSRGAGILHYTWYESGQIRDNMAEGFGDSQFFSEYFYEREAPYVFQVEVYRENAFGGCRTLSEPFLVTVHKEPVVNVTADATEVCENGTVTLTANLDNYNTGNIIYQWYLIDTIVTPIIDNNGDTIYYEDITENIIPGATERIYTTNVTETTTYGVRVSQTTSTCTATNEILITVSEGPVVESITVTGDLENICEGRQVSLTANVEGGVTGGEIFVWYRNNQLIEGANQATYTETPLTIGDAATTYTYNVAVSQTAMGCSSGVDPNTAVTVVVNPAPTVVISGNPIVCTATSDNIMLTANVHPDAVAGNYSYEWFEENVSLGITTGNTFTTTRAYRNHPYSFSVKVYNDYGCSATSDIFSVYVNEEPQIFISASETEICEGGEVVLTADLTDWNSDQLRYQWYRNGQAIAGATSLTYTTTLNQSATFTFTVNQMSSSCQGESNSVTVMVRPLPVITGITVDGGNTTVCQGHQLILTANVTGGVTGNETYTWYRNGEVMGITHGIYMEMPMTIDNEITTYIYNVTVNQNTGGCESVLNPANAVTITVNPNPTVVIDGNPVVCTSGQNNVNLTANVYPAAVGGNYTYEWFESNVSLGPATTNNNYTATQPYRSYPYNYFVKVNNEYGCSVTSDPFYVYVNENPQIHISATQTEICEGGEVTLRADLSDWNTGQLVYQWLMNNQPIPGATSLTYTTTLDQSAQFSFEVSQTSSTCEATSNTLQISVMNRPVAVISSIDNQVVCSGGQVILTAAVTNYQADMGEAVYTWYRNGMQIEGATQSTLIDAPLAIEGLQTSYTYAVQVTMGTAGCTSAVSQGRVVTVNATPTVYVSTDRNLTYCESGNVTLTANVDPVSNNYQYQWYRDNVAISGATSQTYTSNDPVRETSYSYHVVVTSVPGCRVISEPVTVTVVGQPIVTITTDNSTICQGGTATLTATIEGGAGNYTYTWYNNNSSTALGYGPVYTVPSTEEAGTYTYYVEVTSDYGCNATGYYTNFNIVPGPTVSISVANGYNSTVCNGGATLLVAEVTGGVGENSYQWYKNGIILPGETNSTINTGALYYDITSSFTVRVSQTGVQCVAQSAQFNVDVIPMPTVTITGNTNTCAGGTVTLTAEVEMNNVVGNNFTYQWFRVTNGYASPIAGATNAEYTTSALTMENNYEYYVEVSSPVSGCSVTSGTVQANVVADPIVTIMGAHTVCEGGDLTLTAYMTGGVQGEDYTYTWRWWHNGSQQTEVTTVPTFVPSLTANDPSTPYYITVTVNRTDNSGCDATSPAFEVNVISSPQAIVTMDRSTVCQGGSITFTANVTPAGSYNYVWYVNGQTRGYQSQLTLNDLTVGDNQVYVEVIPVNSNSACNATSQTVTATVVDDPVINNITVNETLLCVGGTVRLSVNASDITLDPAASTGDYTYQWAVNGFEIPGAIQPQFVQSINEPGQYQYSLRVIMDNGQLGCASDWSNSVNVTVAPQPQIQVNPVNQGIVDICVGGEVHLQASLLPNSQQYASIYGTPVYDWVLSYNPTDEGGVSTGVTTDQFRQVLNQPGTYYYKAIATYPNGLSCNVATSNSIKVTVYPDPVWNEISVNVSNGALCMGEEVELHASLLSDIHHTYGAIQWYYSIDGAAEIAVSDMGPDVRHTPTESGYYDYFVRYTGILGSGCNLADGIPAPKIDNHTIIVHELPSAEFTAGDGSIICSRSIDKIVPLEVTFTGTPPFAFAIENMTTGQVYAFQSIYQTVYTFNVEATSTSVFRITELRDRYCSASDQLDVTSYVTIYVSNVEVPETFTAGCDDERDPNGNPIVYLPIRITSGNPTTYSVEFRDNAYDNFNIYNGTIEGNATWGHTIRIVMPNTPGDYDLTINIDGCEYSTTGKVLIDGGFFGDGPLVEVRWDDVLVVNNNPETNGGYRFHSYQWYKNGAPVQGENGAGQYYHENGGLSGSYYVVVDGIRLSDGASVQFMTCPQRHNTNSNIRVYPVPAQVNQIVTLEIDLTLEELEGAVLDIYDARGALVQTVNTVQPITKVNGFQAQGAYFGRITTGTNEIKTVKFVIVK